MIDEIKGRKITILNSISGRCEEIVVRKDAKNYPKVLRDGSIMVLTPHGFRVICEDQIVKVSCK